MSTGGTAPDATTPVGAPAPGAARERALPSAARIWVLEGEKPGDNAQLSVVSEALGEPFEKRRVVVKERYRQGKPFVRASLSAVDLEASDPLVPPWPELVLAAGRRMSMVALWIQQQSAGRSRIALLGKPRRLLHRFDLCVVSAQHAVRAAPNVLPIALPLMRLDEAALEAERQRHADRFAGLARPLTAVLVGGPVRLGAFDESAAARLLAGLGTLQRRDGGDFAIVTSRRTPPEVVEALRRECPPGSQLHPYDAGTAPADNPYRALLAEADRFVVSADSLSMMVEVARLGKPLSVFSLAPTAWSRLQRVVGGRSLGTVPDLLCDRGLAVRFGEPFREPASEAPDDLPVVVERVRALLASRS